MPGGRLPAVTSVTAAVLAASCCLVPLALIAVGVTGAGLMMTMMRYEWLTLPLGVGGLTGAFVVYARQRRQCATEGCQFVGERFNQVSLALATLVVGAALLLRLMPAWTSNLLQSVI